MTQAFHDVSRQLSDAVDNLPVSEETDPLLQLVGTGKGLFGDKGADAYVARLRDGWNAV